MVTEKPMRDAPPPKDERDLSYFTAEALSHTEMAIEAVNDAIRYPQEISPLWEKAFDGLTKAYDALAAIRRSQ